MPEATPFQVMIVDDHPLMRRGVRQLLEPVSYTHLTLPTIYSV